MSTTAGRGSWRTVPLPDNWPYLVAVVMERDGGRCQATRHRGRPCTNPASDVDHIDGAGNHDLDNLRAICSLCHGRKTQAESTAAKKKRVAGRGKEQSPFAVK